VAVGKDVPAIGWCGLRLVPGRRFCMSFRLPSGLEVNETEESGQNNNYGGDFKECHYRYHHFCLRVKKIVHHVSKKRHL
jgi:hypothetical protein